MSAAQQYVVVGTFDPTTVDPRQKTLIKIGSLLKVGEHFTSLDIAKKIPSIGKYYIRDLLIKLDKLQIIEKSGITTLDEFASSYESVGYFSRQLKKTQYKNLKKTGGTRQVYLSMIRQFHFWLQGKQFTYKKTVQTGGTSFEVQEHTEILQSIDHFLKLYQNSFNSEIHFVKMIKSYLLDEIHDGKQANVMKGTCSIIKSFFEKNDSKIEFSYDPTANHNQSTDVPTLELHELLAMLTEGRPNLMEKAMVLCKFHRGLDNASLADSFNFEAWEQLVEAFGTDEYERWDEAKCPVLIKLVRVKTQFNHIGFLDVDAIVYLKKYLKYRYHLTGEVMKVGMPLFVTKLKRPLTAIRISEIVKRLAMESGVQKELKGYFKKRRFAKGSHELRDLLDSTLDVCGVNPFLSEHTLGHKQSSYKKQHLLYPEQQREEYAKASHKINIFSNITTYMKQGGIDKQTKSTMKKLLDYYEKNEAQKRQQQKEMWHSQKAIDAPSYTN